VQQHLPNNQDIQQSLEFMCRLHHVHLHHLFGQVIPADPQHKFQQFLARSSGGQILLFVWVLANAVLLCSCALM